MKGLILLGLWMLLLVPFVFAQSNDTWNYVWNESCTSGEPLDCFIPWRGTYEGIAMFEDTSATSDWWEIAVVFTIFMTIFTTYYNFSMLDIGGKNDE